MTALVQAGKSGLASWKTTVLGIIGFVMVLLPNASEFLADGNFENVDVKAVVAAFGTMMALFFARDGDKSSEDVGAKK